ncbi:VOC family protein [Caulobacter sp. 602-1]|jgi:catechol 2,3-dioxygenase-like lactoylglutathione lyase family enzyme|uniref:VOC family protein n=1 Tax=Caulobacter sp. 602-1 TaxID=2492472 RepID=UPI000F62E5D0|nr:VOC family protein [Caulobacter sp. 602-1]RRN66038.1 VOC family protein [Caulobacter sp. 602-1]
MITDLHHTTLFVSDIDRSIDFYRDVLGLELVSRSDAWGGTYLGKVCGMPDTDMRLNIALIGVGPKGKIFELIEVLQPLGEPTDVSSRGRGIARIGFEVDDIDSAVAKLKERGVTFLSDVITVAVEEGQHYSDGKAVKFLDPDGIVLELQQPPVPGRVT